MIDDAVLKGKPSSGSEEAYKDGLHYAQLYYRSTGKSILGPQEVQHRLPCYSQELGFDGITVDIMYEGEGELFTGVGEQGPCHVNGRIIAPEATVFKDASVHFRGRLEAKNVAPGASYAFLQGVRANEIGRNAGTLHVADSLATHIGFSFFSDGDHEVNALRCQADSIGRGADAVTVYDSHALRVEPHGPVQARNSIIKYLGRRSTTSVHAVNTDSKFLGPRASDVTAANVHAKSIGYHAEGPVTAVNAVADSIGYHAKGPVHVYENAEEIKAEEPRHWFSHETSMQSPVDEYSTWDAFYVNPL